LRLQCGTSVRLRHKASAAAPAARPCGCGARRARLVRTAVVSRARRATAVRGPRPVRGTCGKPVRLQRAARAAAARPCGCGVRRAAATPAVRPCGCGARRATRVGCRSLAQRVVAARGPRPVRSPSGTPVRLRRAVRAARALRHVRAAAAPARARCAAPPARPCGCGARRAARATSVRLRRAAAAHPASARGARLVRTAVLVSLDVRLRPLPGL
jgi:hypothetical protein